MSRAYECGKKAGEAIIEMANLFYQLGTKEKFYRGLLGVIIPEADIKAEKYDRRLKERPKQHR